jgi:hypothetical protein
VKIIVIGVDAIEIKVAITILKSVSDGHEGRINTETGEITM